MKFDNLICVNFDLSRSASTHVGRPLDSSTLQILQLQMNDFRYHYMFTTFVSLRPHFLEVSDTGTFDLFAEGSQ